MLIYLSMLNLFLAGMLFYIAIQYMIQRQHALIIISFFIIGIVNLLSGYKYIMQMAAGV
jgi:hypothetical protein